MGRLSRWFTASPQGEPKSIEARLLYLEAREHYHNERMRGRDELVKDITDIVTKLVAATRPQYDRTMYIQMYNLPWAGNTLFSGHPKDTPEAAKTLNGVHGQAVPFGEPIEVTIKGNTNDNPKP